MRSPDLNRLREGILDPDEVDVDAYVNAAKGAASGLGRDQALTLVRLSHGLSATDERAGKLRDRINQEGEVVAPRGTDQLLRTLAGMVIVETLTRGRAQALLVGLGVRCAASARLRPVHPDVPAAADAFLSRAATQARQATRVPGDPPEDQRTPELFLKALATARKAVAELERSSREREALWTWVRTPPTGEGPLQIAEGLLARLEYDVAPNGLASVIAQRFGPGPHSREPRVGDGSSAQGEAEGWKTPSSETVGVLQEREVPEDLAELCPDLVGVTLVDEWIPEDILAILDQLLLVELLRGPR